MLRTTTIWVVGCLAATASTVFAQLPPTRQGPVSGANSPNCHPSNGGAMGGAIGGVRSGAITAGVFAPPCDRPRFPRHDRDVCRSRVIIGFNPFYSLGYGFGGYYGDPYLTQLQNQNALLLQQLELTQRRLAQVERDAADANVAGAHAARNKKAERDRQQLARNRANELLQVGLKAFRANVYARAIERFKSAARVAPDDPTPRLFLAQALFAQRRYADASRSIRDALDVSADWVNVNFDVRQLYADDKEWTAQIGELAARLRDQPLDRDGMFLLGFQLFMSDQKDKARPILEQAASLEQDDSHLQPFLDYFEDENAEVADAGAR